MGDYGRIAAVIPHIFRCAKRRASKNNYAHEFMILLTENGLSAFNYSKYSKEKDI